MTEAGEAMPNPRRTNGSRRNKLRARILREETTCHLCGQTVDKTLPRGRPASPEIDELQPVSLGGSPYDRANCRLAHRWCNRRRWHRPYQPIRRELHANPPAFTPAGDLAAEPRRRDLVAVTSRDWW